MLSNSRCLVRGFKSKEVALTRYTMRMHALVLATVSLLVAAAPPNDDATKKEIEKLRGKWESEATVVKGEKHWTTLVIDEKGISWQNNQLKGHVGSTSDVKFTYKLDPTRKPKEIDLTWAEFANKGKVQLAIYELDGDALKICESPVGRVRPKKFESNKGSGQSMLTLKRVSP